MGNTEKYPGDLEFAFTILDDTDDTTLENGRPVYELLHDLNFRTTKTVWAFDTAPENRGPYFAGSTLSDSEYLNWAGELASAGFEIAFHNATMGSSLRAETERALDFIHNHFGEPVRLHCNHGQNRENLYWGCDRYRSFILHNALKLLARWRSDAPFEGADPGSPYFWSDIAEKRLSYFRGFTFRGLNGQRNPPRHLYVDDRLPSGPYLFSTTDAPDVLAFNKRVTPKRLESLRNDNGWAIVSTHFGKGFFRRGKLDPQFKETMQYLSSIGGWYVPVSDLLDFLVERKAPRQLSFSERVETEYRHVYERLLGRLLDKPIY